MKVAPRPNVAVTPAQTHSTSPAASPEAAAPVQAGWAAKTSATRSAEASQSASPRDVVTRFYEAFEKKDVGAMEQLYAPNVRFRDAIFEFGDRAGATKMWRNLFKTDPHAKLKFTVDSADGQTVKGHWVADYHVNGRPVHNEVSTTMKVVDGKITEHTDDFSWKKWAPQAFPAGKLFTLPGLDSLAKALVRTVLG